VTISTESSSTGGVYPHCRGRGPGFAKSHPPCRSPNRDAAGAVTQRKTKAGKAGGVSGNIIDKRRKEARDSFGSVSVAPGESSPAYSSSRPHDRGLMRRHIDCNATSSRNSFPFFSLFTRQLQCVGAVGTGHPRYSRAGLAANPLAYVSRMRDMACSIGDNTLERWDLG